MFKIGIASFLQETNTFSVKKTTISDFNFNHGKKFLEISKSEDTEVKGFISILKKNNSKIIPLIGGWAVSAGPIIKKDFKIIVENYLKIIKANKKNIDGLLFAFHGACAAEGYDSADTYLIKKIRNILGKKIPFMISLDLHANVTRAMKENVNAIIGYKTCPHTDTYKTGKKVAEMMINKLNKKINPEIVFKKIPMITQAENHLTDRGVFKKLMNFTKEIEKSNEALSVSIFAMQPWLDVKEAGWSVIAVINKGKKVSVINKISKMIWNARNEFQLKLPSANEALKKGIKIKGGPITLGEGADGTMGGSAGDGVWILRAIIKNKLENYKCALIVVDKNVVKKAMYKGLNQKITTYIGGTINQKYNKPIKVTAKIIRISKGEFTYKGKVYKGRKVYMGNCVVLKIKNIHILVTEKTIPTTDPEMYRSQNIEPTDMKFVVVKSPLGLRTEYEPISKEIISVDTKGCCRADLTKLKFEKIPKTHFPFNKRKN